MTTDRALQRFRPVADPVARLFCFPYAGAGASVYRLWAGGVPRHHEVCAVQLPGREARLREPPLGSVEEMVQEAVAALRPLTDRPYALFGHSMGAVLAYETARALCASSGRAPDYLMVSGRWAPGCSPPALPPIDQLDDRAFADEINRRYGGIPAEIVSDAEVLALLLPALRSDMRALDRYRPAPLAPLSMPLAAFGGNDDPRVSRVQLEAWRAQTTGPFRVRTFPGDHFYLGPRRGELLAEVATALESMTAFSATAVARA